VLVDINIWPQKGFEIAKMILDANPTVKIIGMSVNDQHNYATQMLKLGAKGYLTKTSTLEEINLGIIEVFNGNLYICKEIQRNMPGDK
ncbi:MAG TPA: response regulator, partial [Chitinophagaceae bacterium]|nr:response regulator [Chitinophagaceae bacterium]